MKKFNDVAISSRYLFSPRELTECIAIGTARCSQNRLHGTRNMRFAHRGDVDVSVQGVLGEWAFLKLYGMSIEPLRDTRCRNSSNDTYDAQFTLANQPVPVDVKTVVGDNYNLWIMKHKRNHPAGVYGLMHLEREDKIAQYATFSADEQLVAVFDGLMDALHAFSCYNLCTRMNIQVYEILRENLKTWETVAKDYEILDC